MAYTAPQIGTILLKADRTMYKIGQIAYENMFAEDNEALDYERDIIFIYKKAVEYADDFFIGTEKLDKVVERLAAKISAYDYGELNPIYADAALLNISTVVAGGALNDLSDVTITNVQDNQILRYNAALGQWINVAPTSAVRSSQAFTATAGQTVFTTSSPFDAALLDLYLNGVKLNSLSYTTFGEYQITLNDGCSVGDIVDVVIYDPTTSITPAANALNDLTDVNLGPLVNKQALYYNSTSGLWENGQVFVPYTGAVANTDLGEFEMKAGQFTLDTSPTGVASVGTTRWNDVSGVSETTLKGGNTIIKNGIDLVARVVNKVTPNTTLTKAAYQAVRVSGAQGQRLAVAYAQANNDANSADTIGVVCETIPTNQEGFIMTVGQLENINTTGSLQGETWNDGDVLYLSPTTPGALTNIKPNATVGHIVVMGYVEYAHINNGKIYVKIMNGWELDELHNVNINTVTLANGDVLKYNSTTQLWENGQPTGGISGSGASGQVSYWDGTTSQAGSNNLFWDNANARLGIGTSTPDKRLHIKGDTTSSDIVFETTSYSTKGYFAHYQGATLQLAINRRIDGVFSNTSAASAAINIIALNNAGYINFFATNTNNSTPNEIMRINGTGNVLIQNGGTFTDSGERLQVQGTTLLNGNVTFSSSTGMFWDATNSRLGIGTNAPAQVLEVNGNVLVNRGDYGFYTSRKSNHITQNAYWDGSGFRSYGSSATLGSAIVFQTNGLFNRALSIYADTSISSANELLSFSVLMELSTAGNLLIGTTTDGGQRLQVQGTTLLNGNVTFSSSTGMFWDATNSRLGIGTNSPSYTFHVSGANAGIFLTRTAPDESFIALSNIGFTSGAQIRGFASGSGMRFTNQNGTTEWARFHVTSGNFGIGTGSTDSGERLQVTGTMKVTGNVGVNVTPSSTSGNYRNMQVGNSVFMGNPSEAILYLNANATFDSGWKYIINGAAARYEANGSTHLWAFAGTGTAGSTATFSAVMTLTSNGNLGIGNTPTAGVDIKASTTTTSSLRIRSGTAPTTPNDGDIWFDGTDIKMRIGGVTKTFTLV